MSRPLPTPDPSIIFRMALLLHGRQTVKTFCVVNVVVVVVFNMLRYQKQGEELSLTINLHC